MKISSPDRSPRAKAKPHVVGIAAAKGATESLKSLLKALPPKLDICIVIVTADNFEADLETLQTTLRESSAIEVQKIKNGASLEGDRIYLTSGHEALEFDFVSNSANLASKNLDRHGFDCFFEALSHENSDRTMAILLSGEGKQGMSGLNRLKVSGGIIIAQDPILPSEEDITYQAIKLGIPDLVLKVEEIAEHLLSLKDSKRHFPPDFEALSPKEKAAYNEILEQVRIVNSNDFSLYKHTTLMRRIQRRVQLLQASSIQDYLTTIKKDKRENQLLCNEFLITVTEFFRDTHVYEEIRKTVIPQLFKDKTSKDIIRVWVAGCASGEEAISMAILLREHQLKLADPPQFQIFASDIHEEALKFARIALYPEYISRVISQERLERFFVQIDDSYKVRKEIRDLIIYASHSIMRDPPFSRMDMISCRNVMIYLQRNVQKEIIDMFHYSLKQDGILILGTAESIEGNHSFKPHSKKANIFQRNNVGTSSPIFARSSHFTTSMGNSDSSDQRQIGSANSYGKLHQKIVEQFGPPSILVNSDYEIVHFSENAFQFLHQPGGEPSNNAFKRIRSELRIELRTALFTASREKTHVMSKPIQLMVNGRRCNVVLRVQTPTNSEIEGYFLILFDTLELDSSAKRHDTGIVSNEDLSSIRKLEAELEETKIRLQTVLEEYETSQEEMRSSNEELQSTNEELRSTMEELETGKEELQSVNEELSTVNRENRLKVDELSRTSSDLSNFLASTQIPTLFLDKDLCIMRFTPQAGEIFNIRQTDLGRSITDLKHILAYEDLVKDVKSVIDQLEPFETEVWAKSKRWYLIKILPYRTLEEQIEGVAITLVDITRIKSAEEQTKSDKLKLERLANSLEERVHNRTKEIRDLATRLTLTEQRDRKRISMVLHENLQQLLCSINLQLYILEQKGHLKAGESVELEELLNEAVVMTRQLSVELSPPILEKEGLGDCLRWLKTQMKFLYNLDVDLILLSEAKYINSDLQMLLFQLVRELLFNVIKHSNVKKATVKLSESGNLIHLLIKDKGKGFSKKDISSSPASGLGFQSIRHHIEWFGGDFSINSIVGKGTEAIIQIPNGSEKH